MSYADLSLVDRFNDTLSYRLGTFLYRRYIQSLHLRGDEKLLDFGCGGGGGARYLARCLVKGGSITCYDRYGFWVERAAKRLNKHSNIHYAAGELSVFARKGEFLPRFDAILVHFVLHEIEKDKKRPVADTLARLLLPGGTLFIREPVKTGHGMPGEEIRGILAAAGLAEFEAWRMDPTEIEAPEATT